MQGFLYDVYQKTRLVSSLQFMTRCQTLSFDGCFLHTLSSESVDSYTTRVFASAMSGFPFLAGGKDKWLSQVRVVKQNYVCVMSLVSLHSRVPHPIWRYPWSPLTNSLVAPVLPPPPLILLSCASSGRSLEVLAELHSCESHLSLPMSNFQYL